MPLRASGFVGQPAAADPPPRPRPPRVSLFILHLSIPIKKAPKRSALQLATGAGVVEPSRRPNGASDKARRSGTRAPRQRRGPPRPKRGSAAPHPRPHASTRTLQGTKRPAPALSFSRPARPASASRASASEVNVRELHFARGLSACVERGFVATELRARLRSASESVARVGEDLDVAHAAFR